MAESLTIPDKQGKVRNANPLPVQIVEGEEILDIEERNGVSCLYIINSEKNELQIIDATSATNIYFGFAPPGTATSSALWRIKRININGSIVTFAWADGDNLYNNIFDNRAALSYS